MINFIVNPVAGGKNGKKMQSAISIIKSRLEERGEKYAFHYTEKKGDAKVITRRLCENGASVVVAVGGDGTLHEVINGFTNFDKTALGIIPCGTGNDFAAAVNIPEDVAKATDTILDCTPKYTDFMQMPNVRGLNIIGMGIDVNVLERYEKLKKKTKFGYTKCLIKTLLHLKMSKFSANADGEEKKYVSLIACIANGYRYGGGIPICPVAEVSDGKLDFVTINEVRGLKVIGAFLKLKKGKILDLKQTSHRLIKSVKIDAGENYVFQVDGELYKNLPFEVNVVHDTLRIIRP